ncbi:MAG TPA: hypothetical protein VF228_15995 [Iamia sp.]
MGEFRRSTRIPRRITFDDDHHVFPGLEMRIHGLTVGEWLEWTFGDLFAAFCDRLIEWNWVDDDTGEPLATTKEALTEIDSADMATLLAEWRKRVTGVHAVPLEEERRLALVTTNGALESTIPMQPPADS